MNVNGIFFSLGAILFLFFKLRLKNKIKNEKHIITINHLSFRYKKLFTYIVAAF